MHFRHRHGKAVPPQPDHPKDSKAYPGVSGDISVPCSCSERFKLDVLHLLGSLAPCTATLQPEAGPEGEKCSSSLYKNCFPLNVTTDGLLVTRKEAESGTAQQTQKESSLGHKNKGRIISSQRAKSQLSRRLLQGTVSLWEERLLRICILVGKCDMIFTNIYARSLSYSRQLLFSLSALKSEA